jgi:hypothetical protein
MVKALIGRVPEFSSNLAILSAAGGFGQAWRDGLQGQAGWGKGGAQDALGREMKVKQ